MQLSPGQFVGVTPFGVKRRDDSSSRVTASYREYLQRIEPIGFVETNPVKNLSAEKMFNGVDVTRLMPFEFQSHHYYYHGQVPLIPKEKIRKRNPEIVQIFDRLNSLFGLSDVPHEAVAIPTDAMILGFIQYMEDCCLWRVIEEEAVRPHPALYAKRFLKRARPLYTGQNDQLIHGRHYYAFEATIHDVFHLFGLGLKFSPQSSKPKTVMSYEDQCRVICCVLKAYKDLSMKSILIDDPDQSDLLIHLAEGSNIFDFIERWWGECDQSTARFIDHFLELFET